MKICEFEDMIGVYILDIAYHFDVDMLSAQYPNTLYNFPVLEKLFRSLLSSQFQ